MEAQILIQHHVGSVSVSVSANDARSTTTTTTATATTIKSVAQPAVIVFAIWRWHARLDGHTNRHTDNRASLSFWSEKQDLFNCHVAVAAVAVVSIVAMASRF